MTHAEAERALIAQVPVVHKDITYKMISALIYRKDPKSGGMVARAELSDTCGHSVTIARLDRVHWANEADRTRNIIVPPQNEDGPAPQEISARAAFRSGQEVQYEGERHIITALIVRRWIDYNYWLELELTRVKDRQVQQVWSGSVQYSTKSI